MAMNVGHWGRQDVATLPPSGAERPVTVVVAKETWDFSGGSSGPNLHLTQ